MPRPHRSAAVLLLVLVPGTALLAGCSVVADFLPRPAAVTAAAPGDTDMRSLLTGDCLNGSPQALGPDVIQVPCRAEHDYEVFAVLTLPDEPYPGDNQVAAGAEEGCRTAFESFVGVPYGTSSLDFTYATPNAHEWADAGGRLITCAIGDPSGPVRGTLAGAAR